MKKRLDSLDIIRACACLAVFAHHSNLINCGVWSVSAFFMLSGFLMSYNYYDRAGVSEPGLKGSIVFSYKRVRKLYPLHLITMLLMLAYYVIVMSGNLTADVLIFRVKAFLASILLVQSWVPDIEYAFSYNGVSWYLSVAVFLYFMFPCIMRRIRKYKSAKPAVISIVVTMVLQFVSAFAAAHLYAEINAPGPEEQEAFEHWFSYTLPLYRLGDFVIGCNLGYLFLKRGGAAPSRSRGTVLELAAIGAVAVSEFLYVGKYLPPYISFNLIFTLPVMLLIYSFALNSGLVSKLAAVKPVKFISGLSGEIFLVHFTVIKYVSAVFEIVLQYILPFSWMTQKVLATLIIFAATLVFSWLYKKYSPNLFRRRPKCA
ncbi:MAG: acyltransferase family protein [Candidatus Limivicinus sp.]|jgi:peptidoglycan/LPS O-acetylase OafA/YrhL